MARRPDCKPHRHPPDSFFNKINGLARVNPPDSVGFLYTQAPIRAHTRSPARAPTPPAYSTHARYLTAHTHAHTQAHAREGGLESAGMREGVGGKARSVILYISPQLKMAPVLVSPRYNPPITPMRNSRSAHPLDPPRPAVV